jgi:hypothetical protein
MPLAQDRCKSLWNQKKDDLPVNASGGGTRKISRPPAKVRPHMGRPGGGRGGGASPIPEQGRRHTSALRSPLGSFPLG